MIVFEKNVIRPTSCSLLPSRLSWFLMVRGSESSVEGWVDTLCGVSSSLSTAERLLRPGLRLQFTINFREIYKINVKDDEDGVFRLAWYNNFSVSISRCPMKRMHQQKRSEILSLSTASAAPSLAENRPGFMKQAIRLLEGCCFLMVPQ